MRLIVIGASGLIGNAVYHMAKKQGFSVVGTQNKVHDPEFYRYRLEDDDPEIFLQKIEFYRKRESAFAVLSAAVSNINQCYEQPELSHAINVDGVERLVQVFAKNGIQMIYLSSDAVFDGQRGNYTEKDNVQPLCIYGKQKAEVERYLQENFPEVLIYRLAKQLDITLTGNHFLSDVYQQCSRKEKIRCIQGLKFNPTYVMDTAGYIIAGLEKKLTGIYHVASPEIHSRFDLVMKLCSLLGCNAEITSEGVEKFSFHEEKALNTTMNVSKIMRVLPYRFTPIDFVLRQFVGCLNKR